MFHYKESKQKKKALEKQNLLALSYRAICLIQYECRKVSLVIQSFIGAISKKPRKVASSEVCTLAGFFAYIVEYLYVFTFDATKRQDKSNISLT